MTYTTRTGKPVVFYADVPERQRAGDVYEGYCYGQRCAAAVRRCTNEWSQCALPARYPWDVCGLHGAPTELSDIGRRKTQQQARLATQTRRLNEVRLALAGLRRTPLSTVLMARLVFPEPGDVW